MDKGTKYMLKMEEKCNVVWKEFLDKGTNIKGKDILIMIKNKN